MRTGILRCLAAACLATAAQASDKRGRTEASPLDAYIVEAEANAAATRRASSSPGSLWTAGSTLTDLGRDLKASQVDDLVTIVVAERASAVASGTTQTSRSSSANATVGALGGITRAAGPLANLASLSGSRELEGQGTTSRENVLTTTLSARVTHVLPNGYLVVEGIKNVLVNSENQVVAVRGMVRPFDISPGNLVRSERLAQLEVKINGKGVVGDAIRRPFFLYRLLLGILPF